MANKVGQKVNTETQLNLNKGMTSPVKSSSTDTSKLTLGLSGKTGQFGTLTNSTLSASLEKTGSSSGVVAPKETLEVSTAKESETTTSTEDTSVFTDAISTGASDINELDSTLSTISDDNISSLQYAKTGLASAKAAIEQANSYAAQGDWSTVQSLLIQAKNDLVEAQKEAQKAGDVALEQEITVQLETCKGQINSLQDKMNFANVYNSAGNCSGTCAVSGDSSSSFGSSVISGVGNGLSSGIQNGISGLFGGNSSSGGTQNAGGAGGASGSGKASGSSQAGGAQKSSGKQVQKSSGNNSSSKTSGLEYDKNNAEIKKAVEERAVPTYNEGTKMISDAETLKPKAEQELQAAEDDISSANIDIEKLTETNRETLEKYSQAKEKVCKIDEKINEQTNIKDAQNKIVAECKKQLDPLNTKKDTLANKEVPEAQGKCKSQQDTVTRLSGELQKAESDLAKTPETITDTNADGTTTTKPNTKYADLKAKVQEKTREKAKAENELQRLKEDLAKKKAELQQVEKDIQACKEKQEAAQEKVDAAKKEMKSLGDEKKPLDAEVAELSKTIDGFDEKEQKLKKQLYDAYAKKTNAQSNLSKCEADIDAGKKLQDLGEDLRDNAVDKVKNSKKDPTSQSQWYNPFSWFED